MDFAMGAGASALKGEIERATLEQLQEAAASIPEADQQRMRAAVQEVIAGVGHEVATDDALVKSGREGGSNANVGNTVATTVYLLGGESIACDLTDARVVADVRAQVALTCCVMPSQVMLLQGDAELSDDMPCSEGQTWQAVLKHVEPELAWYPAGKYSFQGKDVLAMKQTIDREDDFEVLFSDGTSVGFESDPDDLRKKFDFLKRKTAGCHGGEYGEKYEYFPKEDPAKWREWEEYCGKYCHYGCEREDGCDWWSAIRARKAKEGSTE